jgi:hypothetical protein
MTKTSKSRKTAEISAEYKFDHKKARPNRFVSHKKHNSPMVEPHAAKGKNSIKKRKAMAIETLENLLKKADRLTPDERLLLASRLIESVRQRDLSSPAVKSQRAELKKSLEKLAKMKVFADIKDPVEWQRQIRKDRPLPGREA